jgi:hypothetical protein
MGVDLQDPDRPVIGTAGMDSTSRVFASIRLLLPALSLMAVATLPTSTQQTGRPANSGPPRSKSQCSTSGASFWLAPRMASAAETSPPLCSPG